MNGAGMLLERVTRCLQMTGAGMRLERVPRHPQMTGAGGSLLGVGLDPRGILVGTPLEKDRRATLTTGGLLAGTLGILPQRVERLPGLAIRERVERPPGLAIRAGTGTQAVHPPRAQSLRAARLFHQRETKAGLLPLLLHQKETKAGLQVLRQSQARVNLQRASQQRASGLLRQRAVGLTPHQRASGLHQQRSHGRERHRLLHG